MAEALRVGIAGLGTVGAAVARVVHDKAAELTRQCGREIMVAAVSARDRKRDRGIDLSPAEASAVKIYGSELATEVYRSLMEVVGPHSGLEGTSGGRIQVRIETTR